MSDLEFTDQQLQEIAARVVGEARGRGIEEFPGRNRVDCLLRLESSLGRSELALERVNELSRHLMNGDAGRWAKLRQRAEREFAGRDDEAARRVTALLAEWRREKATIAFEYLSSRYTMFMSHAEWERRFSEFVARRPIDAATWGWLLLQNDAPALQRRYGRADAELAYRNYLETTGAGGARDSRRMFSVPGVEIAGGR